MSRAGSPDHHERRAVALLAAVSFVVYTAAVASETIETWGRIPDQPALHDITIAVGVTALALLPSSAFLDALIASVRDATTDASNIGILSYIEALRTTLIATVALILLDVVTVAETDPVNIRPDAAAIILIAGSTLAIAGSRTVDFLQQRSRTGTLRLILGWCGVVSWPAVLLATQRSPSAIAWVLYLAVTATWATASIGARR